LAFEAIDFSDKLLVHNGVNGSAVGIFQFGGEFCKLPLRAQRKNLENSAILAASAVDFSRTRNICPQTEMLLSAVGKLTEGKQQGKLGWNSDKLKR
jgi:hypothetical protein